MSTTAVKRSLYGKMAGDGTLTGLLGSPPSGASQSIYYRVAPKGARYPFVVFQKQAGTPTYAFVTTPAYETDVWLIRGVDKQDYAISSTADRAEAIQFRLNALLTDGALSISGAAQMYLRRQSGIEYEEVDGDTVYHHAGGFYRLLYQ